MPKQEICSVLVRDIRIPYTEPMQSACDKAVKLLLRAAGKKAPHILESRLYKSSVDARKKPEIQFVCTVLVTLDCRKTDIEGVICRNPQLAFAQETENVLSFDALNSNIPVMRERPVIVGFGPAGMFAALCLTEHGFRPIIVERGDDVEARQAAVARFSQTGILDTESNIQFGAGGAGTFSDGKLMTRISDPICGYVLSRFVAYGADPDILIKAKPHIGTDVLLKVVANIRDDLIARGCTFHFRTKFCGFRSHITAGGEHADAVVTANGEIPCGAVLLALGHSARDTYGMLQARGMLLQPKPFSVGVRIEHLQARINEAAYGAAAAYTEACGASGSGILLPPAEYAVSYKEKPTPNDPDPRGVYSFCMCPGGEVMAAASEMGGVVVNGMSRRARNGVNANAALAVSVRTSDYGNDPMKAIAFQRELEQRAFFAGGSDYYAPAQTVGDFLIGKTGNFPKTVKPTYRNGCVRMTDLHAVLPQFVSEMLDMGIRRFDRSLPGFSSDDAILTGVETRTSAPVRIVRNEAFLATGCANIYPIGEGAGYAGGITSAAVDGVRCAGSIIRSYRP